jgi:hypothetical protein
MLTGPRKPFETEERGVPGRTRLLRRYDAEVARCVGEGVVLPEDQDTVR